MYKYLIEARRKASSLMYSKEFEKRQKICNKNVKTCCKTIFLLFLSEELLLLSEEFLINKTVLSKVIEIRNIKRLSKKIS